MSRNIFLICISLTLFKTGHSILGGIKVNENEFPHMALLGYKDISDTIVGECAGALISDQWVLTTAHCLYNRVTESEVQYVRLGGDDINSTINPKLRYAVQKKVIHPQYTANKAYNDIALLKLDKKVSNKEIIPACIHDLTDTKRNLNITEATATGWGVTDSKYQRSNELLKVTLEMFDNNECKLNYPKSRKMPESVSEATQICYGSRTDVKDTCQGDAGGPLQIYDSDDACTYTIIGITSLGKGCGVISQPAIYTRVSAYAQWIKDTIQKT